MSDSPFFVLVVWAVYSTDNGVLSWVLFYFSPFFGDAFFGAAGFFSAALLVPVAAFLLVAAVLLLVAAAFLLVAAAFLPAGAGCVLKLPSRLSTL